MPPDIPNRRATVDAATQVSVLMGTPSTYFTTRLDGVVFVPM